MELTPINGHLEDTDALTKYTHLDGGTLFGYLKSMQLCHPLVSKNLTFLYLRAFIN